MSINSGGKIKLSPFPVTSVLAPFSWDDRNRSPGISDLSCRDPHGTVSEGPERGADGAGPGLPAARVPLIWTWLMPSRLSTTPPCRWTGTGALCLFLEPSMSCSSTPLSPQSEEILFLLFPPSHLGYTRIPFHPPSRPLGLQPGRL